ncbi:MAG: hypothetical protein KKB31_06240 [Nanoarchaeota archaeon]|nr:hypothetical protein [Nanoarchaeota archaeon]
MKRKDFIKLVNEANNIYYQSDEEAVDALEQSSNLDGIALHNERRMVTKIGAIAFIRWQALQFNGNWNNEELENCAHNFKRVDLID